VFQKINEYEEILDEAKGKNFEDYYEVKAQVMNLRSLLNELGMELRPCHNDTVPENFIKSGEDKVYLIDWEYSGMNDPMWDIAAHSLESNFSEDDEELFLQTYFSGEVGSNYRKRILIHKVCQDFLWSIWTNIKEAKGDDFGTYGIDRYNRAKKNLKILRES
jgi:thiamine kinase-like enzyme